MCFGVVVWFFGAVFGWAFGCQRACGVCSRLLEMADVRGDPSGRPSMLETVEYFYFFACDALNADGFRRDRIFYARQLFDSLSDEIHDALASRTRPSR